MGTQTLDHSDMCVGEEKQSLEEQLLCKQARGPEHLGGPAEKHAEPRRLRETLKGCLAEMAKATCPGCGGWSCCDARGNFTGPQNLEAILAFQGTTYALPLDAFLWLKMLPTS